MRTGLFALAIVVFVYFFGGGSFICMAIGGGLAVAAYLINLRLWNNHLQGKESIRRPLIGSLVFAALVTAVMSTGEGDGGLSDVATGFGGTGLMLVMWLLFKHCGPKELRGSN